MEIDLKNNLVKSFISEKKLNANTSDSDNQNNNQDLAKAKNKVKKNQIEKNKSDVINDDKDKKSSKETIRDPVKLLNIF